MVTHQEARKVVAAAVQKAEEIDQPMNIAVMDAGMNLVAFERMDDAWVLSIDIAMCKAFTAAGRGLSTRKVGEMAQPGQPLFGVNTTNGGRVATFAGGLPLERDGKVVGAVGVSGGPVDQDEAVAQAGVDAFG